MDSTPCAQCGIPMPPPPPGPGRKPTKCEACSPRRHRPQRRKGYVPPTIPADVGAPDAAPLPGPSVAVGVAAGPGKPDGGRDAAPAPVRSGPDRTVIEGVVVPIRPVVSSDKLVEDVEVDTDDGPVDDGRRERRWSYGRTEVYDATLAVLEDHDRVKTPLGATCLVMARRLDSSTDTGSAIAQLARQLEATLLTAVRGATVKNDLVDEVRRARDAAIERGRLA